MKIALVRQGAAAAATGSADVVSSTTAGSPTPDSNRSGTMIDRTPPSISVCGSPRRAVRIASRSPSSRLPMRP